MKTVYILLLCFLFQHAVALNIRQITISPNAPNTIRISLETEAVELYYFHSWQYEVSNNEITLDACFVEGFGSTIAFLNNNFEIPIGNSQNVNYTLIVKIYYTDLKLFFNPENIQDEYIGYFSTPLNGKTLLSAIVFPLEYKLYPNPTEGLLILPEKIELLEINDPNGKKIKSCINVSKEIDLTELSAGIYFIRISNREKYWISKIIKK